MPTEQVQNEGEFEITDTGIFDQQKVLRCLYWVCKSRMKDILYPHYSAAKPVIGKSPFFSITYDNVSQYLVDRWVSY